MFRSMALKELREIRGIAVGAVILYGIITVATTDFFTPRGDSIPFIRDRFVGAFYFFPAVVAIVFGLWQTFGESLRGTYPFLLHRPASRSWLMGMKLFVGTAVCLVASAIPLLIYSFWAATPGNHASPFAWSMTMPVWIIWFAMTIVYLGAFLTGIMPGPWYRARFLPLAASIFALVVVAVIVNEDFAGALWPCWIVLAVDIWLVAMIFFVAQSRDFS